MRRMLCNRGRSQRRPRPPWFVFLHKRFPCSAREGAGPTHATTMDMGGKAESKRKTVNVFNGVRCHGVTHLDIIGCFLISNRPVQREMSLPKKEQTSREERRREE